MPSFGARKSLALVIFMVSAMTACEASSPPANGGSEARKPEATAIASTIQPPAIQTPVPLQPAAPTPATALVIRPAPTRAPLTFPGPTEIPPVVATETPTATTIPTLVTTATPALVPTGTPAPMPTAASRPTLATVPTITPTPATAPTPTPTTVPIATATPTAQPAAVPSGNGSSGGGQVAAQLVEVGPALLWIAGFDNTTKVWLAYDPSGTLDPSILGQHLPSDYQPGELIQLKEGNTYLIAISEQVTLRGDTLDEGIYQIIW